MSDEQEVGEPLARNPRWQIVRRPRRLRRTVGLREAAATIFALTAILPVLVFLSLLNHFELVRKPDAQVGLLMALLVAILGFIVFRGLVDQIARMAKNPGLRVSATVPGLGRITEIRRIRRILNRLLGDVRDSTDHLKNFAIKLLTLNEIVELAARTPRMQDFLERILERSMRAVQATIGSIMLLDRDSQTLRIVAARGLPEEVVERVEIKVGERIAGKIVELGEPVLVDDIATDPRFAKTNNPKYGNGSFVSVPIRAGHHIIGVMNLARKESEGPEPPASQSFTGVDLRFLTAVMTYVACVLENARLHEEIQQLAGASASRDGGNSPPLL